MTDSDPLRRYIEAGFALTQLTRARAEALVRDLVKAGDVQRGQAQERVEDLLDRSRKSTEGVMALVRNEVQHQLSSMGFATKQDLENLAERLERRFDAAAAAGGGEVRAGGAGTAPPAKRSAPKAGTAAGKARKAAAATPAGPAAGKAGGGTKRTSKAAPPPGTAARTAGSKAPRRAGGGPGAPADAS